MTHLETKRKELAEKEEELAATKESRNDRQVELDDLDVELDDFEIPEHEVRRMLDTQLDDCDRAAVVGIDFDPSRILQKLDPIAYSEACNNLEDSARKDHPQYKALEEQVNDANTDVEMYNDEIDDLERDILELENEITELEEEAEDAD